MGEKKLEVQPEHVSTGWIAKKHCLSTETIRREIAADRLRCTERFGRGYMVKYTDYLDWRARRFEKIAHV